MSYRSSVKTNISKINPKLDGSISIENTRGRGLQMVVIYAGRKYYSPLYDSPLDIRAMIDNKKERQEV